MILAAVLDIDCSLALTQHKSYPPGTWYLGTWSLGAWYLVPGTGYLVPGVLQLLRGGCVETVAWPSRQWIEIIDNGCTSTWTHAAAKREARSRGKSLMAKPACNDCNEKTAARGNSKGGEPTRESQSTAVLRETRQAEAPTSKILI